MAANTACPIVWNWSDLRTVYFCLISLPEHWHRFRASNLSDGVCGYGRSGAEAGSRDAICAWIGERELRLRCDRLPCLFRACADAAGNECGGAAVRPAAARSLPVGDVHE